MKTILDIERFNQYFSKLKETYDIYGPVIKKNAGRYSDTDLIIYEKVNSFNEMCFEYKSDYSFKNILLPLNETLFLFNESGYYETKPYPRPIIIFLRSCDMHAIKRLDEIYLNNKYSDVYYASKREMIKYAMVGCNTSFENCYCVSFETNKFEDYNIALNIRDSEIQLEVKDKTLSYDIVDNAIFEIDYVQENKEVVEIPKNIKLSEVIDHEMWDEYSTRCIGCGACNVVCPTCTCFSMQDIYYEENHNVGERRRVMASCMVDGFTNMAGNHQFREDQKDRMRFKVLHKVSDYKQRFGYHMCVGCGRCDDVCPEHIKFSKTVSKLAKVEKEEF